MQAYWGFNKDNSLHCGGLVTSYFLTLCKNRVVAYACMDQWAFCFEAFVMEVFVMGGSECSDWHIVIQRFSISILIGQSPWQMSVMCFIKKQNDLFVFVNMLNRFS